MQEQNQTNEQSPRAEGQLEYVLVEQIAVLVWKQTNLERKIRLLEELQGKRKEREAGILENMQASLYRHPGEGRRPPGGGVAPPPTTPSPSSPEEGSGCGGGVSPAVAGKMPAPQIADPPGRDLRQSATCEEGSGVVPRLTKEGPGVVDALFIWLGVMLAAAFQKIKNRGNELKDLLQAQGISEIGLIKRTRICADGVRLGAKRAYRGTACRPRISVGLDKGRASPTPTRLEGRQWTRVARAGRPHHESRIC